MGLFGENVPKTVENFVSGNLKEKVWHPIHRLSESLRISNVL